MHRSLCGRRVCFADSGRALLPEKIERLFDPFSSEACPGLDLFLVRQLVEDWGGNIQVESLAGGGTTFVLTCPVSIVQSR